MSEITKIYASQEYVESKIQDSQNSTNQKIEEINTALSSKANVENPVFSGAMGLNHAGELGFASVSLGYANQATGMYSFAEGMGAKATGDASHAEGTATEATGYAAHAEGYASLASETGAHAEGGETLASGYGSHAEGNNTIAAGEGQHAEGKYNIQDTTSAHIVGNGTSNNSRSNAHIITWEGDGWYAGDVYVGSNSGTNKDEGSKKLATEEYVTNNAVSKSGDTMTGNLRINKTSTSSDTANVTTVLNQTDTGDASEAAVISGADRAVLEYKRVGSNGEIKDHNWICVYDKYAFSYWSPNVAGNEANHYLATTKAVAEYVTDQIIVSSTEPAVQEGKIWLKPV